MEIKAKLNYLRIAPRKVRLVADLIRGRKAQDALSLLNFTIKRPGLPIAKLLSSAIANASNNFHIEPDNLIISKITVDEGPMQKRWMPRARGVAGPIHKKTSHIALILKEADGKTEIAEGMKRQELEIGNAKAVKEEKAIAKARPKFEINPEIRKTKPRMEKGIKRIFRRKAIG